MKRMRMIITIAVITVLMGLNACSSLEPVEVNNENVISEDSVVSEDQTDPEEEDMTTEEKPAARDVLERFLANEVQASVFGDKLYYYRDIESEFETDFEKIRHEYRDVDNDGEEELLIYSEINFYPVIVLDVDKGEIRELCGGGGTAEYLTFHDVDGVTWACFSDTTHQGRQFYNFKQYQGTEIVDEFILSAEYWENENDWYDENSDFSYRDKKITMEEYEELLEKWTGAESEKSKRKTYSTALGMYDAVLKDIIAGERGIYDGSVATDYGNSLRPGYALYDIDGDGTPELFITDDIYKNPHIYTVYYWDKDKEPNDTVNAALTGYIPEKEWWVEANQVDIAVYTYNSRKGFECVLVLSYPWENDGIYEIYSADESLKDITEKEVTRRFEREINEPEGINWIKLTKDFDLNDPDKVTAYEEEFGKEISVDAATQRKMNIFLSNFSEALMYNYDKDHRDLQQVFKWIYLWCEQNKDEYLEYDDKRTDEIYYKISLENINKITGKYLGFELSEEEASEVSPLYAGFLGCFYENGYYYETGASGEEYTLMSIVEKAEDLGDGRLKLYYKDYSRGEYGGFDPDIDYDSFYGLTVKEASHNPILEEMGSGYAIVRVKGDSYILEHLE